MDPRRVLERFPFYREGSPELRAALEASATPARLEAGTHFYLEGDRCSGFAMVGRGTIRVYKLDETGRQITLYEVREGETCLIDMLCTILGTPAPATALALTDVEALIVPADTFRSWIRDHDPVRDYVFRALSGRLVDLMALVEHVAFRKMDRRLAGFLLGRLPDRRSGAAVEATHAQIAAELGSAREVISRLLEDFERRGGISLFRGRIVLQDPGVLKGIADGVV